MRGQRGLGRGLSALIPQNTPGFQEIPVEAIVPNPRQPRQRIAPEALAELADSIRRHGLLQPVIVTRLPSDQGAPRYQLIAGERRWQAARMAGLTRIPALIKEATPEETLALALVENIQRADLNPLEEAAAYRQLIEEFGLTQEEVAARVGKSRAAIANTLRLLNLPEVLKTALAEGRITEGHARALLGLPSEAAQCEALTRLQAERWTVRETEEYVRRAQRHETAPPAEPEIAALEERLQQALGTRVQIVRRGRGGRLVVYFYSDEQLESLLTRLTAP